MDLNIMSTFEMNGVVEDTRRFFVDETEVPQPVYKRALVPTVPVRCFYPGCDVTLGRAPLFRFSDMERARLFARSRYYISDTVLACRSHNFMLTTLQSEVEPLIEAWPWCTFADRDYHAVTELMIRLNTGS